MSFHFRSRQVLIRLFSMVLITTSVLPVTKATAQDDPLHIWVGKLDAANAEKWVKAHFDREKKGIDVLLAVNGPRTVENTLQPLTTRRTS